MSIDILFDGPAGPDGGRFIEVERSGYSINIGEWIERDNGWWCLRIPEPADAVAARFDGYEAGFEAGARDARARIISDIRAHARRVGSVDCMENLYEQSRLNKMADRYERKEDGGP